MKNNLYIHNTAKFVIQAIPMLKLEFAEKYPELMYDNIGIRPNGYLCD